MSIDLNQEKSACLSFVLKLHPGIPKIIRHLHIKPELWSILKNICQFKGHHRRNSSFVPTNFINDPWGAAHLFSQSGLGHVEGNQELFLQYGARFCGFNIMWFFHKTSLMIVANGNLFCRGARPSENNSPLIVDPDRIKSMKITGQCFQSIPGWNFQVFKFFSKVQHIKLLFSFGMQRHTQGFASRLGIQSPENISSSLVAKGLNHAPPFFVYHYTTQWNQKRRWSLKFLLTPILLAGCVSRAPTQCELDRRSGLYPNSYCEGESHPLPGVSRDLEPDVPARTPAVIKKVWVSDQMIEGGHWMQGTWVYLEVEPSRWQGAFKVRQRPSLQGLYSNQSHTEQTKKGEKAGPNPRFKEVGP
jgi:hypothetical protein